MRTLAPSLVSCLILGVLLAGCDEDGVHARRQQEQARREVPLDLRAAPEDLARQLRQRGDPEPLVGTKALRHFDLGEMVHPSRPVREPDEAAVTSALTGFATRADRSQLPEFSSAQLPGGRSMREHLQNAILMNTSRMGYYAERAGPLRKRSLWLSRYMVVGETVSLPTVRPYDDQAGALRARGLLPMHEDLVPLVPLPRETPPTYHGVASAEQRRQVKERTKALRRELGQALDAGDLQRVADLCYAAEQDLMRWEREWGMHWQMTRHTIGSVGHAALAGLQHGRDDPARLALSVRYVKSLVAHTISYGRQVDRMAQPLQARGLGIVLNEFTDQPFLQAYARSRSQGMLQALDR